MAGSVWLIVPCFVGSGDTVGFRGPMWLDLWGLGALHGLVWLVLWAVQALGGLGPLAGF